MKGFIDATGKQLATQRFMAQPTRAEMIERSGGWNAWRVYFAATAEPQDAPIDWLQETGELDATPEQECDGGDNCTVLACQAQDGGFVKDVTWNGMDAEGPCGCEHHQPIQLRIDHDCGKGDWCPQWGMAARA